MVQPGSQSAEGMLVADLRSTPTMPVAPEDAEPLLGQLVRQFSLDCGERDALLAAFDDTPAGKRALESEAGAGHLAARFAASFAHPHEAPPFPFDATAFWRHALATGWAARLLAPRFEPVATPAAAFACGLLHDIGKLALASCFPKAYRRVLTRGRSAPRSFHELERELLGVDHTIAGRRLAIAWRLPAAVSEVVWLHHHAPSELPPTVEYAPLLALIRAANQIAHRAGFCGWSQGQRVARAHVPTEVLPHISAAALGELSAQVRAAVAALDPCFIGRSLGDARSRESDVAAMRAPETVLPDGPWRAALDAVLRAPVESIDLEDTCRQLAETIRRALGTEVVAVFAVPCGSARAWTACATRTDVTESAVPLEGVATEGWNKLADAVAKGAGSLVAPPAELAAIEERYARVFAAGRPAMLAFAPTNELVGGLLLPETVAAVRPQTTCEAAGALAEACALVLTASLARRSVCRYAEAWTSAQRGPSVAGVTANSVPLELLARLAAGAAHELNNPLAVIAGRAQLLRNAADQTDMARHLDILEQEVRRATQAVTDLLAIAKPDPPAPRAIPLGSWAQGFLQYWQRRSGLRPAQITLEISDPAVTMHVDPFQFETAAGAILANAVEATAPENAHVTINSTSRSSDDTVVVSIVDNGRGMSPEVLRHALDPFFSDRPAGRGRGMGLPRAARLLEVNGGRLWIESLPQHGTTVYLAVPARPRHRT